MALNYKNMTANIAIVVAIFTSSFAVLIAITAMADDGSEIDLCLAKSYPNMTLETLDHALDTLDDINAPMCRRKETVLFRASYYGSAEQVQLLINRGADPNIIVNDGCSAICRAAIWGNGEALDVLLKNGTKLFEANDRFGRIFDRLIYYAPPETAVSLADYVARSDHELDQKTWFFAITRYDDEVVKAFLKHRKPYSHPIVFSVDAEGTKGEVPIKIWDVAISFSPNLETIKIITKSYIDHYIEEFDDTELFQLRLKSYFSNRDIFSYKKKKSTDQKIKEKEHDFIYHFFADGSSKIVMPLLGVTGYKINYKYWQKFPFLKISTPGDWESPVNMVDELSTYLKQARGGNNAPE